MRRNVLQAVGIATQLGTPYRARELMQISVQHYCGDHSQCHLLFNKQPGDCRAGAIFSPDGPAAQYMTALFDQYFGYVGQVRLDSLGVLLLLHTNACESFGAGARRYTPKDNAFRTRWPDGTLKQLADVHMGCALSREVILKELGCSMTRSMQRVYTEDDERRARAVKLSLSGASSAKKAKQNRARIVVCSKVTKSAIDTYKVEGLSDAQLERAAKLAATAALQEVSGRHAATRRVVAGAAKAVLGGGGPHPRQPMPQGRVTVVEGSRVGRPKCGRRRRQSPVVPESTQDPAVPLEEEPEEAGFEETEDEGSGGEFIAQQPRAFTGFLDEEEGAAYGWQHGAVRYAPDAFDVPVYGIEYFVLGRWTQSLFHARKLDMADGEVDPEEGAPDVTERGGPMCLRRVRLYGMRPQQEGDDEDSRPVGDIVDIATVPLTQGPLRAYSFEVAAQEAAEAAAMPSPGK